MRLHAVGGLCNRLRAILSHRAAHGAIDVIWQRDIPVANAHFLDVFEPLPGVNFLGGGWDVESFGICPDAPTSWEDEYLSLFPVAQVSAAFYSILDVRLGRSAYDAIHIRSTDHIPNACASGIAIETYADFGRWLGERTKPVWLATDNGETQRVMRTCWGRRVQFNPYGGEEKQALEDHHRNSTLQEAVVDLWICAMASEFKGTTGSSFSDTIKILRRLNGRSSS
jgi:hypothetical protein